MDQCERNDELKRRDQGDEYDGRLAEPMARCSALGIQDAQTCEAEKQHRIFGCMNHPCHFVIGQGHLISPSY
jgi:hypothetical protein